MKLSNKKGGVIGLCVILALALLFFGIDYLKGINVFKPENYYVVSYTNVSGLQASAPVTVNGFKVGQVREINYEYDNPGHVKVELSLDKSLRIPEGTRAIIDTDMLGTATVRLEMGASDKFLAVGSELIGENARGLMENVSQDLMPSMAAILPKIDTLLYNVNQLVAARELEASIQRLDVITANIETTMINLNRAVATLPSTMNNVAAASKTLTSITANVDTLATQLNTLPLTEMMANVQASTENLKALTEQLRNPDSTLGQLMHDRQLYDNLTRVTQDLDSLFIDIKAHPKRYINIKLL